MVVHVPAVPSRISQRPIQVFAMHPARSQHDDDFDLSDPPLDRDPVEFALAGLGVLFLSVVVLAQILLTSTVVNPPSEHMQHTADAVEAPLVEPIGMSRPSEMVAKALSAGRDATGRQARATDEHAQVRPNDQSPGSVVMSLRPLMRELAALPWDQARVAACDAIRVRVIERLDFEHTAGSAAMLLTRDALWR